MLFRSYSGYNSKHKKRKRSKGDDDDFDFDFSSKAGPGKEAQREVLKKGIDDLQQRLDNIETIMQSRKATDKENKE